MRGLSYAVLFFLAVQMILPFALPRELIYNGRINYEVTKNKVSDLDLVLDVVSQQIQTEGLRDYIVVLGDSVAYSGPGGPQQSISHYMEDISRAQDQPRRVFNLAMPAMQMGDIYTMLLKLKQHGISTEHLVINLIYQGFTERQPDPPIVFWLDQEFKQRDPATFALVRNHLAINQRGEAKQQSLNDAMKKFYETKLYPLIPILKYKDYITLSVLQQTNAVLKQGDREAPDTRPWYEKPGLAELLDKPEYQKGLLDQPFVMDTTNPQILLLNKVMEQVAGKNVIFFLAPINQKLMQKNVTKAGYQENLQKIDAYFQDKPVKFLNLENDLDQAYFTDHVHLTPAGYQQLAQILYREIKE